MKAEDISTFPKKTFFRDFPLVMLIFLAALIANLRSIFRLRAALELENLALRHQIGVLQRALRESAPS